MMSTQAAAESPWPEVGQKDPNPSAHGRKIQNEISAMMECASRMTKKGKAKAYPQAKTNALFKSILEFIEKVPGEPAGAIDPEATTKGDLDALAAKILEAVSFQSRVSPTASRTKSFVEALTTNSPPQSYPQSVLSRMTPTSAAPISSRKLREIRVKTNFNNDNRARPGHSRTSAQVVKMANEGIERAGLLVGPGGSKAIEMATVQVSGDYLLIAKDAATAERLTMNGPQWVTCLGGNAEVVTPVYTVMVMNIPVSTFNPQEQEQMRHTLIGSNYQLLADHKINHMDWMMKPRQGKATGTIVISFMTKAGANAAIAAGILAWEGQAKRTIRYDKACRVLQCFRCYEYGHTTRQCRNKEACGHCAEEHLTRDCPAPNGPQTCTLCKGTHSAWDQRCVYRKKDMERAEGEKERVRAQPYYLEDPAISPGPSERGSVVSFNIPDREVQMEEGLATDPTPAEAAAASEMSSRSIAERIGSQTSTPRNQEMASALRPQGVRKTTAPRPTMTPVQAKRAMANQMAINIQDRQCEPGSDAIEAIDDSQHREVTPPSAQQDGFQRVVRRRSQRGSTRTRNNSASNE